VLPSAGIWKSYDWFLVFLVAAFIFNPNLFLSRALWREFSNVKIFIGLLVFMIFYSVFIQNIELSIVIRVFRNFIFILSLFLFCPLDKVEMEKVFRWIVYFTSIAAFLYCLQVYTGTTLLNTVLDDYNPPAAEMQVNNGIARYYNLPVYVIPVTFFLLFDRFIVHKRLRWLLAGINVMAIVFSQHRNLLITVLVCVLVYYVMRKKIKFTRIALVSAFGILVLIALDMFIGSRLSAGFNDLKGIMSHGLTANELLAANLGDMSTSAFRFYLFYERWNFITADLTHSIFGLGLITEDSAVAQTLSFNVGGIKDELGSIAQIDTSDIAWAPLILYFGIAGTAIFLSIYLNLLARFYKSRADVKTFVGFLFIISLLFTSFYSITLISQPAICLLMLFAAYQYRRKTSGQ
jgi:hypothetical protein